MVGVDQQAGAKFAAAQSERAATPREPRRDAMLATLSHDLRSPLFSISMALDLVERIGGGAPADARVQRALATVRRSAARLLEIADDLSDLASLEAGHLTLALGPVEPEVLIRELCETLATTAAERSIMLACTVEGGLPSGEWDGARLRRALACLISMVLAASVSPSSVTIVMRRRGPQVEVRAAPARSPRAAPPAAENAGPGESSPAWRVAAGIIAAHGGTLVMEAPGAFTLSLPLSSGRGTPE